MRPSSKKSLNIISTINKCYSDLLELGVILNIYTNIAGSRSANGNVSACRSRGREFDPSRVPYFRED